MYTVARRKLLSVSVRLARAQKIYIYLFIWKKKYVRKLKKIFAKLEKKLQLMTQR